MAQMFVTYWRDIPAQVTVRRRRETARRELPRRFIEAVDAAAMRVGAKDSDAYLAEWRRGDAIEVSDDLEKEAEAAAVALEADYPRERVLAIVSNEGREP